MSRQTHIDSEIKTGVRRGKDKERDIGAEREAGKDWKRPETRGHQSLLLLILECISQVQRYHPRALLARLGNFTRKERLIRLPSLTERDAGPDIWLMNLLTDAGRLAVEQKSPNAEIAWSSLPSSERYFIAIYCCFRYALSPQYILVSSWTLKESTYWKGGVIYLQCVFTKVFVVSSYKSR